MEARIPPFCADSTQPLPISEIPQLSIPASATPVQFVRDFLVETERFATKIRAVRQGPEAAIGAHHTTFGCKEKPFVCCTPPTSSPPRYFTLALRHGHYLVAKAKGKRHPVSLAWSGRVRP